MKPIKRTPRLQFTEEERAVPELQEYIQKAEQAAEKAEKSHEGIPKKHIRQKKRTFDEKTGKATTRLYHEEVEKTPQEMTHPYRESVPKQIVSDVVHRKIHEVEQDNSAVESVHQTEKTAEILLHEGRRQVHNFKNYQRLSPYRNAEKAEKELQKANQRYQYQKNIYENPDAKSNPLSRMYQKQRNKRTMRQSVQAISATFKKTGQTLKKGTEFVVKHRRTILICSIFGILSILLIAGITACTALLSGAFSSVSGSTFMAQEEDIIGAEEDYILLETALNEQLANIETTYSGYDEYVYSLDRIHHDPYVLTAILSVINPVYTRSEVQNTLVMLFERQYQLNLTVKTETRYRTEERTASYTRPDGSTYLYTYTVEVEYTHYILNVELVNHDLSLIPEEIFTEEQLSMYETYLKTHGNRPDLFS